jgi:hypothetical protein
MVVLRGSASAENEKSRIVQEKAAKKACAVGDFQKVVGQWIPVSFPITDSSAATATTLEYSLFMIPSGPPPDNVCMQWQGTIYLDAFSLN